MNGARNDAALEALADRIADKLAPRVAELVAARIGPPSDRTPVRQQLVDAATVAEALGVKRRWVYEHAEELGVRRLDPTGRKPRLRFDLERVLATQSLEVERPSASPHAPRSRRSGQTGSVLQIRPAGIKAGDAA